ncbi:MAG: hypothetical protein L0206_25980, partial [Actinobacteria bacterium]|nr:hypothetical protein [Actinomycetota bacterium]
THGCDPWRSDTDGDLFPDGYEVANGSVPTDPLSLPVDLTAPGLVGGMPELDYANAALVKYFFETGEPTTWTLTLALPNGRTVVRTSDHVDTVHTAIAQGLEPSTILGDPTDDQINHYTGSIVLRDLSGNPSLPIQVPAFDAGTIAKPGGEPSLTQTVVGQILHRKLISSPGVPFKNAVRVRVDWRENGPPALPSLDQVVVAKVLVRDANGLDWNVVPGTQILTDATAREFQLVPEIPAFWGGGTGFQNGDLLVLAPTAANGLANVRFTVVGGDGKELMFNVMAVIPKSLAFGGAGAYNPAQPVFDTGVLIPWIVPPTMIEKDRSVIFVQ